MKYSNIAEYIKSQLVYHTRLKASFIVNTALVFILVNCFWLAAAEWFFVFRPYLNYDYLIAVMFAPLSAIVAIAVFLLVYAQEIFINNALVFHFDSIVDFFRAGEFADSLNIQHFIALKDIILFGAFLALAIGAAIYLKGRTNALAVMIVLILAFSADQLNGSSYFIKSDDQLLPGNVAGSSLLKIRTSFLEQSGAKSKAVPLPGNEPVVTKDEMLGWAQQNPERSILFVIVESYGLNDSEEINTWLYDQLVSADVADIYDIEYGAAPFSGATTSSELRHLCALRGNYSADLTPDLLTDCIPQAFADQGYPVIGAHGFSGNMFRRTQWWPQIGLKESVFAETLAARDTPYCGSGMYGVCDEFIIEYLAGRMRAQPGFYYHLTLNTHLPVVKTDVPARLAALCKAHDISNEACILNARLGVYLRTLAQQITALPAAPLVFVAGDHAPPFSGQASRKFSRSQTPYFILRPQQNG